MKNKKSKRVSFLTHNYSNFTENVIAEEANFHGINSKIILERHIWIYELHSQLQKRLQNKCILKGGACAQLYIPLESQRCTEDLDLYTSLSPNKLRSELTMIAREFNQSKFPTKIREYMPKSARIKENKMPITTFLITLPFIFKENRKKFMNDLKIDFLHLKIDKSYINYLKKDNILGMKLNYTPVCLSPYAIMGSKLLTFSVNILGVEKFKKDKLYKNAYDLFYLINQYNTVEDLKAVGEYLNDSILKEFYIKKLNPIGLENILEDILKELLFLSLEDITFPYSEPSLRLNNFLNNYIQYNIKNKLDFDYWGIIYSYLFLWTHALKHTMIFNDFSKIENINKILGQWENFQLISTKEQLEYIKNIKSILMKNHKHILYDTIENPLRFIYLYSVLSIADE